MNKEEEYLESLDLADLLDLFEAAIRCNHYCPCECKCFDGFRQINYNKVKDYINKNYKYD